MKIKIKTKISLMIISILLLQVILPIVTIIKESEITLNSYAQENSTLYSNIKINSISELNNNEKAINSHEGDTKNSNLEFNYRESKKLIQNKNFNYATLTNDELDNLNNDKYFKMWEIAEHMAYPRLKKLKKETSDGYKYILTFQNSVQKNNSGIHIYYTRSKDLKEWEEPKILFKGIEERSEGSNQYCYFTSCDTLVLEDGETILAVASKWGSYYGDYGPRGLNDKGLYLRIGKYGKDYEGIKWEDMKKIYTGNAWEPSIIELSTGEIQIYFTHKAPAVYITGKNIRSTGTALISSLDGGNTWTPNIEGTNEEYSAEKNLERNPYSAYRISQQFVKGKTQNAENKEILITDKLDFNTVKVVNDDKTIDSTYEGGLNADGKKAESNECAYKMTNQMPVAIELNNKNRIALVTESLAGWLLSDTEVKRNYNISISYSDKQDVKINGKSGEVETKGKYWVDLNEDASKKEYETEEEVYDNEGLGIVEEGPVNNNFLAFSGSAPYIQQFPSGETTVLYNKYYGKGWYPTLRVGDTEANFTDSTEFIYDKDAGYGFASIALLSSHCMALTTASTYTDENEEKKSYIGIYPMQLNHTINAEYLPNAILEDNKIAWNDNTDALFIGSDSQAQMTIRAAYDEKNIYFLLDRLDNSITEEDTIEVYVNTNSENNNYYKVLLNKDGVKESKLHNSNGDSDINITNNIYINDTNDDNGGYKAFLAIPKEQLGGDCNTININAVLNNKDKETDDLIQDTFTNVDEDDVSTWNKIRLYVQTVPTINYDDTKLTNKSVTATITFNKENVKITNNEGKNTYTFNENGNFTFEYKDEEGNVGSATAVVNNIYMTGDINEDKKVNISDLLLLKRHLIAGSKTEWILTDKRLKAGDINEDEKVNISDLLLLKRLILKKM